MLKAEEEAMASLEREIDKFIEQLSETYDEEVVKDSFQRKASAYLRRNGNQTKFERAMELLKDIDQDEME